MAKKDIQRYMDGIESQHSGKPRFMAHLAAYLEKMDSGTGIITDMPERFYIDTAVGNQLDTIGRLIGVSRTISLQGSQHFGHVLDDEQYRALLYAKIFANHWDGTIEMFYKIWEVTIGRIMDASYVDNQDMTADLFINGRVSPILLDLFPSGQIIPKPMGVRYRVTNRLPEIKGRNQLYVGAAMYGAVIQHLGPVPMPEIDTEDILTDGLGEPLMDGLGVALTDGGAGRLNAQEIENGE